MPVSPDVLRRLLTHWPDDSAGFAEVCSSITDWPGLLEEVCRHGVLGVLAEPLAKYAPAEVCKEIERRRLAERLWGDRLRQALAEVLSALEGTGTQAVVLKGPALSDRLYGDPSIRLSSDLDILIRPASLDQAAGALESLGYRPQAGPEGRYYRRYHHHLSLERPQGPPVELHFRAFTGLGIEIGAEDFLARSGRYQSPQGLNCSVLSSEDELLFLAVHAAGHGLTRLAWLYDLKTWLRRYPEVDWETVKGRAHRRQVEKALLFTMKTLHHRLAVEVPEKSASRHRTADRLLSWYERFPGDSRRGKFLAFLLQASLCERPGLAFGYLRHHFGRIGRRRLQSWLPAWTPEDWAG